ncbi:MAG: hypothetical protein GXP58_01515 [Deltaproteobacteria bacterium]|nr:hypothetical protein [Deltaproteobacteria bacterium]
MASVKIHPHPIAVHFSNGLIPVSIFFLFLFFFTRNPHMEIVAFYTLWVGTLGSALALGTGLFDWKKHYRGAWVPVFKKKLTAGVLAILGGALACLIRYLHPGLLLSLSGLSVFYVMLNLFVLACVGIAGYLGGKLVFQ